MTRYYSIALSALFLIAILPLQAFSGEPINRAVDAASSSIDSAIESWASENIPNLRLIEIDTKIRNASETDYRILTILELSDSELEKYLSQISFSSYDNRETFNLGLVWRAMNKNKTLIYGVNAFYDREINSNHSRLGLGFELKSSVYDVNLNLYEALTGRHSYAGAIEEAADGYDLEVAMYLPYMPWAKVYYKGYEWDSSIYDVKNGESLSLHLQPTSRVAIEIGRQQDNTMSTGLSFLRVDYIICCNNQTTNRPVVFLSPTAYSYQSIESRFFEKVRRQNNVVKGIKGAVNVGRGT